MATISKEKMVMQLRHGARKIIMPKMKAMVEMEIDSIERMTQKEFEAYVEKKTGQTITPSDDYVQFSRFSIK